MTKATICDRCGKVLRYGCASMITLYIYPYGEEQYGLCKNCTKELKCWLEPSVIPWASNEQQIIP